MGEGGNVVLGSAPGFASASLRAPLCIPAAGPPSTVNSRFSRYCVAESGSCSGPQARAIASVRVRRGAPGWLSSGGGSLKLGVAEH